jgi:uncharacterized membrane protein (UPF0127 family)
MRRHPIALLFMAIPLAALAFAACDSEASPTATPTPAPPATGTPFPPTATPRPTAAQSTPTATAVQAPVVTVGGAAFLVEIARTFEEKARGLSGRPQLAPGTGMIFPYDEDALYTFWMKGMLIPLDFVWIDGKCTVADVTANVPPPRDPNQSSGLPVYSPSRPVRYILEITAGDLQAKGIRTGDPVRFANFQVPGPGCP